MAYALIISQMENGIDPIPEISWYGQIRLWVEGDPPTPTDYYVVIGDFKVNQSERLIKINPGDLSHIDIKLNDLMDRVNVQLDDYGIDLKKSFCCDIKIPQELIDGYTE